MARALVAAKKRAQSKETGSLGAAKSGAVLGFEATLWQAAEKLRNNMDAAEYKHVVLGFIFLKYVSDTFEEQRTALLEKGAEAAALLDDPAAHRADNGFWVPPEARWSFLQVRAKEPTIGELVDDAMVAIERENPSLAGVLPKDYARASLDKKRLGELVELISTIGLGEKENRCRDVLGRVYEYFLGQFAAAEGKNGGQFYTPQCVVRLLVEMLAPEGGIVYDPCCGSGGMFVQSERFVREHGGQSRELRIYGQESNHTTYRLAKLNLTMRGISADIAWNEAGSFLRDAHEGLLADYVIANPPFNDSDWGGEHLRNDARWALGLPPAGNANFAWVQHFIHHLAPAGFAGFVLANGSMSSTLGGEGEIRRAIVEADLLDCMVALPGHLFYSTQIPVCLWLLARSKNSRGLRDRKGQTLFIDARDMGRMVDRVHAELRPEDIARIASLYRAFRGDKGSERYEDVPGFARMVSIEEIRFHKHSLVPGRYVGFAKRPDLTLDRAQLQAELRELVTRFGKVKAASNAALTILRELLNG